MIFEAALRIDVLLISAKKSTGKLVILDVGINTYEAYLRKISMSYIHI